MRFALIFALSIVLASAWREQRGVKFPKPSARSVPESYGDQAVAERKCDQKPKCDGLELVNGRYTLREGEPELGTETNKVWLKNGPTPSFDMASGKVYLKSYVEKGLRFTNRREAERKCIETPKCGGVTLYKESYTMRIGTVPIPSTTRNPLASWVKNLGNIGNNRGTLSHDACKRNNGGCDMRTTCIPSFGGTVQCGLCPEGFEGLGDGDGCIDIDECSVNNGGCHRLTRCTNLVGRRACGMCPSGYTGNGEDGCKDVNECKKNNGGCDGLTDCLNTDGGFICGQCPEFYTGNGLQGCRDVDECLKNNGGCDYHAQCINTPGGRTCGKCPEGYTGDGLTGCIQDQGGEAQVNTTRPETYAKMVRRITDGASDRALHLILKKKQQLAEQERARGQVAMRKLRVADVLKRTKELEDEIEAKKREMANSDWDQDLKRQADLGDLATRQADRLYKAHAENPTTGGDTMSAALENPSEDLLEKLNSAIANLN